MWPTVKSSLRLMIQWLLVIPLFQQVSASPPTTSSPSPLNTSSIVVEAANAAMAKLTTPIPLPTHRPRHLPPIHPHLISTHPPPSTKPALISIHKLHKHINKVPHNGANGTADKLHKFDLFIDPVCEQLPRLTDRQINRVFSQLCQLSKHTSNHALAKCFTDNGFQFDASQPMHVMKRHNLADFCKARETNSQSYNMFSQCSSNVVSPGFNNEVDAILRERIAGPVRSSHKKSSTDGLPLSNEEKSLIDDIVAHIHEEQVQEIATETALEHKPSTIAPNGGIHHKVIQNSGKLDKLVEIAPAHTLVINANFASSPSSTTPQPAKTTTTPTTSKSTHITIGGDTLVIHLNKSNHTGSRPHHSIHTTIKPDHIKHVVKIEMESHASNEAHNHSQVGSHQPTGSSKAQPATLILIDNHHQGSTTSGNTVLLSTTPSTTTTASPSKVSSLLSLFPVDNSTVAPALPVATQPGLTRDKLSVHNGAAPSPIGMASLLPSESAGTSGSKAFLSEVTGAPTVSPIASFLLNSIDPNTKPPVIPEPSQIATVSPLQAPPPPPPMAATESSPSLPPPPPPAVVSPLETPQQPPSLPQQGLLPNNLNPPVTNPPPIPRNSPLPPSPSPQQPSATIPQSPPTQPVAPAPIEAVPVAQPAIPPQPFVDDAASAPNLPLSNTPLQPAPVNDLNAVPVNNMNPVIFAAPCPEVPESTPLIPHPSGQLPAASPTMANLNAGIASQAYTTIQPMLPLPPPLPPAMVPPATTPVPAPILPTLNKATMMNVKKALAILEANTTTTTAAPTSSPSSDNTVTIKIKSTSATTTPKPSVVRTQQQSLNNSSHGSKGTTLVVVKNTKSITKKPQKRKKVDLIELGKKYGNANVHDVIVVGPHEDGDDEFMDYDNHDTHHGHEHVEEHKHKHHTKKEMVLQHKATTKLTKKTSKTTIEVERVGAGKDGEKDDEVEEDGHGEHEHLIKGLKPGDVVHVDAGDLDQHQ